jgi:tRNA A-37 threonylcarbamoyl transferase component Bud32
MRYCPQCYSAYPDRTSGTCPRDGVTLVNGAEYAAIRSDALIGTTLVGRYEIGARIGSGGMGTVYRAKQTGLGRPVALKVLKRELVSDRETVARFHREAKAMSLLQHPNTVHVFDFGEDPSAGYLYLAMELLEGELLTQHIEGGPPIELDDAIQIAREILRSLAEAHGKGLVHRDLKPDNIYLAKVEGAPRPIVKVLDFGIAKVFRQDEQKLDQLETQAGTVFGTPRYMSPEQAQGKALDPRSDLYAVGVLLYQMLVGRCPFVDDDAVVVMAKHIRDPVTPPRQAAPDRPIPPSLDRIVMKALEKHADRRFASAEEFEQALAAAREDVAAEKAAAAEGRRSTPLARFDLSRVPRGAVLLAAGVVLLATAIAALTVLGGSPEPEPVVVAALPAVPALPATAPAASSPAPLVRSVTVLSEPDGARVYRDELLLGTTPLVVEARPGAAPLTLRLERHEDATLDLAAAGPTATVSLEPVRRRSGGRREDEPEAPPASVVEAPPSSPPPARGYERFE